MAKTAVIKTGGKQYVAQEGDVLTIEKLPGAHEAGEKISFDEVLLVDDGSAAKVGTPTITGAKVEGELVEEGRGKKLHVIRFKSKSRYRTKTGHRQPYAKVKITKIG